MRKQGDQAGRFRRGREFTFQIGAIITGEWPAVRVGEVMARIPQESSKTATLPVVCRVWRSCSERVHQRMRFACRDYRYRVVRQGHKGKQRLSSDLDGVAHEYLIPKDST